MWMWMWICGWRFLKVSFLKTKNSKKYMPGVDNWEGLLSFDFKRHGLFGKTVNRL